MTPRLITTTACLEEGAAWLRAAEPRFASALDAPLPLRRTPDGFDRLLSAIVSQQVSVAAARAIWGRLETGGLTTPEAVAEAPDDALRAAGLSRQKVRYARALAAEGIDWDALRLLPTDDVVARLTRVPGVGIWTAEIYAMFALGHADVFAPGDLALQEGARTLLGLADRPSERALRQMSLAWSPWRSVAARALWAHYAATRAREGVA